MPRLMEARGTMISLSVITVVARISGASREEMGSRGSFVFSVIGLSHDSLFYSWLITLYGGWFGNNSLGALVSSVSLGGSEGLCISVSAGDITWLVRY
jgi:hypothetical protein